MKANLPRRWSPRLLAQWEESGLYQRIRKPREGRPTYILHDGPPYANGNIHLGHAFNKILKDFVVKLKTMEGFRFSVRSRLGLPRAADRDQGR